MQTVESLKILYYRKCFNLYVITEPDSDPYDVESVLKTLGQKSNLIKSKEFKYPCESKLRILILIIPNFKY